MHDIDYSHITDGLLTKEIVNLISAIHELKGQQTLFVEAKPDILSSMLEVAKIQSTESSNRIEGIFTSEKRVTELVQGKVAPRDRNESEIAGYRDVLATIHENYDYLPPRPNIILQLHRDLYKYSPSSIGGHFKNADNIIEERDTDGQSRIRFQPVSAFETPLMIENICTSYINEIEHAQVDPLLLIPVYILDFLCIHPFSDGNGRMSRLLTLLLLYRAGYIAGKYISIEMLIEKTKESYYEVLQAGSQGWHENKSDYKPFVEYYLGIILNAYKEFASRVDILSTKKVSKRERVKAVIENHLGKISKKEIALLCPDISETTIERTLGELLKAGEVVKIGGGRGTAYVMKRE
jgi:Fic family protein